MALYWAPRQCLLAWLAVPVTVALVFLIDVVTGGGALDTTLGVAIGMTVLAAGYTARLRKAERINRTRLRSVSRRPGGADTGRERRLRCSAA